MECYFHKNENGAIKYKKKILLYSDDQNSNYWNIRNILLTEPLNLSNLKDFIYMRYGGDDLAKKTLDEINTNDPNKSYLILNAGSGFGSDMIEQSRILPRAKFIGIEYNQKYADLSSKIIQALNLSDRIKIYNANIADSDHMKKIIHHEGLFDSAYSNLVLLHIKEKTKVYSLIYKLYAVLNVFVRNRLPFFIKF